MSEEAHNSICPECGSYRVTYEHTVDYDWQLCTCGRCGCSGTPDEFFHNSVFARITASPEVLAEKLVYVSLFNACWYSTLTGDVMYKSREEAEAATVEKLKEIAQ